MARHSSLPFQWEVGAVAAERLSPHPRSAIAQPLLLWGVYGLVCRECNTEGVPLGFTRNHTRSLGWRDMHAGDECSVHTYKQPYLHVSFAEICVGLIATCIIYTTLYCSRLAALISNLASFVCRALTPSPVFFVSHKNRGNQVEHTSCMHIFV